MASRPDDISRSRRQSFAFEAQAPAQRALEGGPQYSGAQLVGGRTTGSDQSPAGLNPTNFSGQIGGFVDNLLKPYAERKAKQRFIEGMTDQMYAEAGEEVRAGNGILTQIFGPSAYEEGAIFYEARERVAKAQSEWQADEDELKRLPPREVAKAWAEKLEQTKTGDTFADAAIESSMLEASGPMLQSVAKARYGWQQQTTIDNQQRAWKAGAAAYQAQAASFASTADPSADQIEGYEAATNNFLAGIAMPAGQDEESYRKSVSSAFRQMIQQGNGHAATALVRRGILDVLTPEERIRAEDQYERYGKIAAGNSAADFMPQINVLQGKLTMGELSGEEAVGELRKINEQIKRATGFDFDYYDTDDQEAALKGVWSAMKAAEDKRIAREQQIQDRQEDQQFQVQLAQQKAEAEAANARGAFASDSPGSAMVAGAVTESAMQAQVYAAYQDNDMTGLSRAFRDGITSPNVKNLIQNTVSSTVFSGYTQEFDGLHKKFEAMLSVDGAIAKEYFGAQYAPMLNYRKQLSGGASKQIAFDLAFGDDIQYSPDGKEISKARKDVSEWVSEQGQPGLLSRIFAGETKLNASGVQELSNMIGREMATDNKFGGATLSNETLMTTALARVRANGQFEKYGRLAWSNRPGTVPLHKVIGLQQQEANALIPAVINHHLKKAGYAAGADGDEYTIVRGRYNSMDTLIVVPVEDGVLNHRKSVVLTASQFRAAGQEYRKLKVAGYKGSEQAAKQQPISRAEHTQVQTDLAAARKRLASAQAEKPGFGPSSRDRRVAEAKAEIKRLEVQMARPIKRPRGQ